ncbi:uncharacterized protein LOC143299604 [Babylonia areolata]|uniref:uncharacterized protein LOC143299604 n=1 Tax=Babylonia areolata TaxID=304850 RepID=UPI003FD3A351
MGSTVGDDPSTMTCGGAVIEEFQSDRVGLAYNRPCDFLTPQWPCRKRWYLLYRGVVALLFTSWAVGDMVFETNEYFGGSFWRWFLYATNWSLLLLTLSTLMQAFTSALFAYKSYWVIELRCAMDSDRKTGPTELRVIHFAKATLEVLLYFPDR